MPAASSRSAIWTRALAPLVDARAPRARPRRVLGAAAVRIERQVDVRYVGQSYEITRAVHAGLPRARSIAATARSTATRIRIAPIEVVAVRVRGGRHDRQAARCRSRGRAATHGRGPHAVRAGRFDGAIAQTSRSIAGRISQPGAHARRPAVITGPRGHRRRCRRAGDSAIDGFGNVIAREVRQSKSKLEGA